MVAMMAGSPGWRAMVKSVNQLAEFVYAFGIFWTFGCISLPD